jgi:chemotaxis protein histidine kinase CheA
VSFRIATAFVDVKADDSELREDLDAKVRAAAEGATARVRIDVDADRLPEQVRAAADAADAETHVKVKVDEDGADLRSGIERLGQDVAGDADQAGAHIGQALGNGLFRDAAGVLRNSSGQFATEAEKIAAGFDNAGRSAENAGRKASGAGGGFRLASVGIGAAAASAIALIPALAAVPGVAAAAAAGIATLAGAFFGVGKALHDFGAAQDAVGGGGGGGNTAATAYSNAVAVRGAEQAIADAREQSARSAQQSAEQIKSAQQGVVDAERSAATATQNAADQVVAAQQRVTQSVYAGQQAEQAYTNAVYAEQQAQTALVSARQSAADQLVDSQNSAKDAQLATEQAAANAKAAQLALTAADTNSLLTTDQKATLDLAARTAVQQLADARQREKEAVEKANAANAAGVDKAPQVLSAQHAAEMAAQATATAQHGLAAAAQQQADAQAALAKANRAAADQQITSAEQVAKAQQSLADAQRQADQQRQDSTKSVQRAEQNLTDTLKEQQLSADSAGASGSAAASKFAEDYAKLTPAAKAFVDQVLSMRGELHKLAADAQTATLPGFTQMLKDSEHLMPVFEDGVNRTGHALSDMAVAFGHLFANPDFDASALKFEQIVTGGFGQFTSALPPLLNAIVTSGVQAAPLINAVAVGVHDLVGSGLPAFLSGLTTGASGAAVGVSALFKGVDSLLGPVGTLAGSLAGAMGPALGEVVPEIAHFADEIVQSLLPLMPELSTDLMDVAHVVDELFQVFEPIIPLLADELGTALRIIDPLLKDTAGFLHDNADWLTPVAEGILGVVAAIKIYGGVSGIIQSTTGKATQALGTFSTSAKTAAKDAETAAESVGGARGLAGRIGGAIPVVGGLVAAGVALGSWLTKVADGGHKAATSIDQYTTAMLSAQGASALLGADSDALERLGTKAGGTTDKMAGLGIALGKLSQMAAISGDGLKNYDGALAGLVSSGHADRAKEIIDDIAAATDNHGKKLVNTARDFPAYFAALDHQAAEQASATTATDKTTTAVANLGTSLVATKDKWQIMSDTMSDTESLDRFHTGLLNLKDAADQNGTSLDGNTKAGLANRQTFSDLADQIREYGQKLHDSGASNDTAAAKMQTMIDHLEDQGKKFGFNKDQVDQYIKHLGLIPSSVETKLNTEIVIALDKRGLQAIARAGFDLPAMAGGGPVVGPGTGTSDQVPRRLSNGEYVVPADAAARIGPTGMEQIRHGQVPQVGGTTPQAAAPVVNISYYGTQQPSPEQQQVMMRDLALAVRG